MAIVNPLLSPATIDALEKAWSAPKPKRRGGSGGARKGGKAAMGVITAPIAIAAAMSHAARSEAAVAKLSRVVKRSPQVLVKVTGRQKGAGHVAANFKYIAGKEGREGREDGLETDDGDKLRATAEFKELAETWAQWDGATEFRRTPTTSISMVFSMPEGTNPDMLKDSVRAFAQKELDGHRWAMGMHTDTPRPHVHLTVCVAGEDGVRFNPRKPDLQRYREEFARELRDRGIEADATPRKARGIVKKPEKTPIKRMRDREAERRQEGLPPARSRHAERLHAEVRKRVVDGAMETPIDAQLAAKQRDIKWTYMNAVAELLRHNQPECRQLAGDVAQFVKDMPAPETRATTLVKQVVANREMMRAQEQERVREKQRSPARPTPSRNGPER